MKIWKDIKGFEGWYKVSNDGDVKSIDRYIGHSRGGKRLYKGAPVKKALKRGYWQVRLKMDGNSYYFNVHRLVAAAFIPNKEGKPQVNHIDGDKLNNHVSNLEWCTVAENIQHAVEKRLIETKLTDEQAVEVHDSKLSNRKLAAKYGINSTIVWRIKNELAYKHLWNG